MYENTGIGGGHLSSHLNVNDDGGGNKDGYVDAVYHEQKLQELKDEIVEMNKRIDEVNRSINELFEIVSSIGAAMGN